MLRGAGVFKVRITIMLLAIGQTRFYHKEDGYQWAERSEVK